MEQRVLTLQISVKTGIDEQIYFKVLKDLFPNADISVKANGFDWNAEATIKEPSEDEYRTIADQLYSALIAEMSKFTDWEYKFISDMYRKSEEKETYSSKQKEWIDKLKEKYL
jgi:hypothetical protein